jgi:hypothetical protein
MKVYFDTNVYIAEALLGSRLLLLHVDESDRAYIAFGSVGRFTTRGRHVARLIAPPGDQ